MAKQINLVDAVILDYLNKKDKSLAEVFKSKYNPVSKCSCFMFIKKKLNLNLQCDNTTCPALLHA